MLSTGIRSSVGVKVFGPDLSTIEQISVDIERELKNVKHVRTAVAERVAGGFFLDVDFDRESLSNFGLSMMDAQDQLMAQVGGQEVNITLNGREHFPVTVRLSRDYRENSEEIKNVVLMNMAGQKVALSQVAKVKFSKGPAMIRNENGLPVGYVFIDVDTNKADIGSTVEEMKKIVEKKIKLPPKYSLTFSGQYENMIRVKERLKVVIPITLFIIFFLLYFNTKSWVKTAIVLLAVPFSLVGAVWLMYVLGYHMSIAAWVGMIALMGLDAETGVFMLLYLDLSYEDRMKRGQLNNQNDLVEAIYEGAVHRLRPKLMTVSALIAGLIPIMWSSGAGADVMKRIAAPMIGGIATSFLLELLIYPVIYFEWRKYSDKLKA